MRRRIRSFIHGNDAATAIEYALIGGFLALAIIVGLTNISGELSGFLSEASSALK
jgi:Flp pilus assembly pilin Flp